MTNLEILQGIAEMVEPMSQSIHLQGGMYGIGHQRRGYSPETDVTYVEIWADKCLILEYSCGRGKKNKGVISFGDIHDDVKFPNDQELMHHIYDLVVAEHTFYKKQTDDNESVYHATIERNTEARKEFLTRSWAK